MLPLLASMNFRRSAGSAAATQRAVSEQPALEADFEPVFLLDALRQHVELELADDADEPLRAELRLEDLRDAFSARV